MNPPAIGIAEFAVRFSLRPSNGDWLVLIAGPVDVGEVAESLMLELAALGVSQAVYVRGPGDSNDLVRRLRQASASHIVCEGMEGFETSDWVTLDEHRSQLQNLPAVALLLSRASFDLLSQSAPHLASWLTASVFVLDSSFEGLTDDEREERLRNLRATMQLSNEAVVERALNGTLPRDPVFAEWLILMRRGDLLAG